MVRNTLTKIRGSHSRRKVARNLGITPQMLGMIESGKRTPSLALAKKIADFFSVPIEHIFFEENRNEVCLKKKTKEMKLDGRPSKSVE